MMKSRQSGGKVRVVLDTNVVVSAAISDEGNPAKIFALMLSGVIENISSVEIIAEVKEVFERPKISALMSNEDKEFFIDNFENLSVKIETKSRFTEIKDDPSDNKFIEVAVDGGADYIVSGDPHLTGIKSFEDIRIVTPKEFLDLMAAG